MIVRPWTTIAVAWLFFALLAAAQNVAVMGNQGMHHDWIKVFVATALSWLPWALVTPLVLWLAPRVAWPVHIGVGALTAAALAAWGAALTLALHPYRDVLHPAASVPPPFGQLWLEGFVSSMLSTIMLYSAILVVRYLVVQREQMAAQQMQSARLGERLARSQLDALRHQIEPHFLFNTLNSIAGLVREGRDTDAVTTIAELSAFLRATLETSQRHEVPLGDEIAFVERYLAIQKVRFSDRLRVTVDVPAELSQASVPQLILQPLVENAVDHGIAKRASGGEIRIAALRKDGTLLLRVCNDGPKLPANCVERVGLTNVRARLSSLYGDAGLLRIFDSNDGVEAVVTLPLRDGLPE